MLLYCCTSTPVHANGHGLLHHVGMTSNCHLGKLVFVLEWKIVLTQDVEFRTVVFGSAAQLTGCASSSCASTARHKPLKLKHCCPVGQSRHRHHSQAQPTKLHAARARVSNTLMFVTVYATPAVGTRDIHESHSASTAGNTLLLWQRCPRKPNAIQSTTPL
jgi:hypothetical protein